MNACEQLARVEWFAKIVIRAHFKSDDSVNVLALGGEHDDRRLVIGSTQATADRKAVFSGHHQIQNDQVRGFPLHDAVEGFAIFCQKNVKSLLREVTLEQVTNAGCRPAVDVLFRSVAAACGGDVLGVILTGMGQDGLHGCRLLRERHAQILAQDEATSVVWGMPGYVAQNGLADRILPLGEVAPEICRRAAAHRQAARLAQPIPS